MTILNVDELIDHFLIRGERPCAVVGEKMAIARRAGIQPMRGALKLPQGEDHGEGFGAKEALANSTNGPGNKDLAAYCVAYFDAVTILSKRGKFLVSCLTSLSPSYPVKVVTALDKRSAVATSARSVA
jgi:hypothetical protein